ncbi:sulfatase-like hydrolase/transferase [Adhaeribacter sp. BT258]|uniref:Sulfatase-like hydrolase/transferase n=1 Tax=Adhaeribacter terrigena TaxID=2793070 RepID=A0ABS1C376_9BACT|nr:LTA synthase family protein [Adhaeribacter terrigena]MBK0403855.1 sulfatase-like hydrolase/transferase [Adhaeribacter terrigena]
MFWLKLGNLLKRLGFLLIIYTLLRSAFLTLHFDTFSQATNAQIAKAFVLGIRFDLAAIFMVNLPFLFFCLLPFAFTEWKRYQLGLKIWFVFTNFLFLCLNLIDLEYFKFIGRRTSNELFTITRDIQAQAGQLLSNYWYFPLAGALLLFLLIKLYPKERKNPDAKPYLLVEIIGLIVMLGAGVLFIRGGTALKPLRPANAFVQEPPILGHVTLNTTFTFIKSINSPVLDPKEYFATEAELHQALNYNPDLRPQLTEKPVRDNVVIIILESFASEYTGLENNGKGYTPFFDSLAARGNFYREHYANGRKSIEALPPLFAGLPSLMNQPYITSSFQSNKLHGIGSIAKEAGYSTSFFHGAENGTMGFNTFARIAGFEQYYGLREYPKNLFKTDFDGHWGILDEPYLQYFAQELNNQQQPFLTTVFTLSSHQPYTVPAKYQGRFPKGQLPIHESIGYADFALRQFFKTASKQPWYKNTLFIITADHTQESVDVSYQNDLGRFKIPLLLFHPTKMLPVRNFFKITQHADIPATIAHYLNLPANKILPFSNSVLDTTTAGRAILYTDDNYVLVHPDLVTKMNEYDQVNFFQYAPHQLEPQIVPNPELEKKYTQELKALVQYYRNGLIENNLYFWLKR